MSDELHRTLGRIEGKLDTYIASQTQREEVQDTRLNTHSTRLTKVENRQIAVFSYIGGAGFVLGLVVGAVKLFL